ncbi:hypothetical protein M758_UG218900 [Ceratodon purpureus]|nr:hypothetical protein M758_UG218900 [Ceratodon purpureus]
MWKRQHTYLFFIQLRQNLLTRDIGVLLCFKNIVPYQPPNPCREEPINRHKECAAHLQNQTCHHPHEHTTKHVPAIIMLPSDTIHCNKTLMNTPLCPLHTRRCEVGKGTVNAEVWNMPFTPGRGVKARA